jgi:hypothetical protein
MLIVISLAAAGTWNICSATEATASVNAGWTIYDVRDVDGDRAADHGTFSASTSLVRRWQPRHEEDLCDHTDGMGGLTLRTTTAMVAVDALPGEGSCPATVWGDAYGDIGSQATVTANRIGARVEGHAVTSADAGNTGTIGVDGGGGARFTSEWAWSLPGAADVSGTVDVEASAAYNGATLDIPGWAQVDAYDGAVDAWVRRGAEWVHVTGTAPMTIPFGALVPGRGQVCATGSATSGAHAEPGGQNTGGAGIRFTFDPVRGAGPVDARPTDGPEFDHCGC